MTAPAPRATQPSGTDPRERFLRRSGWLDPEWYAAHAPVPVPPGGDVIDHYLTHGAPAGMAPNRAIDALQNPGERTSPEAREQAPPRLPAEHDPQLLLEMRLVRESGLFDDQFYRSTHRELISDEVDPLLHFCRLGWRLALRPNPGFDPWWYWINHLDPGQEKLNPLVHYILIGQAAGHTGVADHVVLHRTAEMPSGRRPRRICLFAGFDTEAVLDDYVVDYVRELSRFADVYYLCDGYLPDDQLAKLDGIASGAWAIRHGAYDFGSYSMLARDLVGWDRIAEYDELLLVNDSCYLLSSLDDIFDRMDRQDCAWWGLQATKGIAFTQDRARAEIQDPIPIERVLEDLVPAWEHGPMYDFLVGSYFLAYRRPVIEDLAFRQVLDSVHKQRNKLQVVLKYEVGLTHYLNGAGYVLGTYIPALYPFHPIFSAWYFELLRQGFPLLKKYLLYQNHYDVPDLNRWKETVTAVHPQAKVDTYERNLLRTSPADRLARSLAIVTQPDGRVHVPLSRDNRALRRLDRGTPTFDHWWAFVVAADGHTLPESSRAILDHLRDDPSVRKVVLTRSKPVAIQGENLVVAALDSDDGQELLVRSRHVFVQGRHRLALMRRQPDWSQHRLIIVRDGLSLQRSNTAQSLGGTAAQLARVLENPRHPIAGLPVASDVDQIAALAEHYPATYRAAWRTGLPAHDFLTMPEERLPSDLLDDLEEIRAQLDGRRLVLLLPGARRSRDEVAYQFTADERRSLLSWAERNDVVLGLREDRHDLERAYRRQFGSDVLDLAPYRVSSTQVVLRASAAVVTDVSGYALDFMLTGRPVLSFVHDPEAIGDTLNVGLDQVMPSPVAHDFEGLMTGLERLFDPDDERTASYERIRRLLVDRVDDQNTRRVVDLVRRQYVEASA